MNLRRSSGVQALRQGRVSIPGQSYLLTTVCRGRARLFADAARAAQVAAVIRDPRLWRASLPICWVLMPDHLHALVALGGAESLTKLMQRVKCVTSAAANAMDGRRGSVWMSGYHDRALRSDEHLPAVARYVVANPVRAGLVSRIAEYPHWGCAWPSVASDDDPVG